MKDEQRRIPYGAHHIDEEDIQAVVDVLRSHSITQGIHVPKFESAVALRVKSKHCVAVNSATSALHIACEALGLGPGDHLWTSPITFVASANCGRYCGAEIDFVDIDPATGLICPEKLDIKLEKAAKNGRLPKVLIAVHLCGTSCDLEQIQKSCNRFNVRIIEDASHAIGAKYKGEPVGNCKYSSIAVFSFHPVKIVTTGEGGMACTNDEALHRKMLELRSHGIVKDPKRFKNSETPNWGYEQQDLGFNYRMTDFQAALGISQLTKLSSFIEERSRIYLRYKSLMSKSSASLVTVPEGCDSSHHLVVVRLTEEEWGRRNHIVEQLRANGIGVQLHYSPVHLQPYYKALGFRRGDFPGSEEYGASAISLPIFPGLSDSDQEYVLEMFEQLRSE